MLTRPLFERGLGAEAEIEVLPVRLQRPRRNASGQFPEFGINVFNVAARLDRSPELSITKSAYFTFSSIGICERMRAAIWSSQRPERSRIGGEIVRMLRVLAFYAELNCKEDMNV